MTGAVDAVSYLALGRVFTANMTGNVVFLGFGLVGAKGLSVTRSSIALAAFLAGAAAGGRLASRLGSAPRPRWIALAFGAESLLLAGSCAAAGFGSTLVDAPARLNAVIVLTALAMGLRNATVRKLGVKDLTTTVLTLTLTGLAADSILAGGDNAGWRTRIAGVLAMLVGAGMGAWLLRFSAGVPLAACAALTAALALVATRRLAPTP